MSRSRASVIDLTNQRAPFCLQNDSADARCMRQLIARVNYFHTYALKTILYVSARGAQF